MIILGRQFQSFTFCLCDGLLRDSLGLEADDCLTRKRISESSEFTLYQLGQAHVFLRIGVLGLSTIFIILFLVTHGVTFTSAHLKSRIAYVNSWRFSRISLCRNLMIFYLNFALLGYFYEEKKFEELV